MAAPGRWRSVAFGDAGEHFAFFSESAASSADERERSHRHVTAELLKRAFQHVVKQIPMVKTMVDTNMAQTRRIDEAIDEAAAKEASDAVAAELIQHMK